LVAATPMAGQRPGATTGGVNDQLLKISVITDLGRVDDRSFNQFAWKESQQGAAAVGGAVSWGTPPRLQPKIIRT
ncbi:hypothetical protein, partial [Candidatus Synechococcus spongiarum]